MFEDDLDFRSEDEQAVNNRVVKRVDAEMIACQKEPSVLAVVNEKGKLAIDLVKEIQPMLFVQVQQDFNIRVGAKAMALLDQYFFQLEIVEDLAIAHQHHGPVFVVYRLVAALQVDNAQTAKAESQMIFDKI